MFISRFLSVGCVIFTFFGQVFAATEPQQRINVPVCLAKKLANYPVVSQSNGFRVLQVPLSAFDHIQKVAEQTDCGKFINLSEPTQHPTTYRKKQNPANDYHITHQAEVELIIKAVQSEEIEATVAKLSSFVNRSATQRTGEETAHWLQARYRQLANEAGIDEKDIQTWFVPTGKYYLQPSFVVRLPSRVSLNTPGIVVGAHMDTLGKTAATRMPGAGDNASGAADLLEIARVLLNAHVSFNRPVYLVWYAAEEQGLVGSQQVVDYFRKNNLPVSEVMQLDMAGYRQDPNDPTMWLFTDYTHPKLTAFTADLIKTYLEVPVAYSTCGYGCSDHVSWTAVDTPAVFPCETNFKQHNPRIHTEADTPDWLNTEHLMHFTQLGLAFIIELALA